MDYAAMRPGEVADLRVTDCVLPESGWGQLLLWKSAPVSSRAWTDHGATRDNRQLKHRSVQDTRPVPAPPLRHAARPVAQRRDPPQRIGEWAGHSVHVLLRVYAKCLDGEQDTERRRLEAALGLEPTPAEPEWGPRGS